MRAIVLAAGAGSRFGEAPKLLADLDGRPVLDHVVAAACAAQLEHVVLVLGARAGEVAAGIDRRCAEVVVCDDWAEGQSASLRRGLEALGSDAASALVLLGDQPLVTPAVIDRMAREPAGSRAAYGGVPGHPAVLGPEEIAAARALHGDAGLRDLPWRLVECGDRATGRDVDTPRDLEAIREARAVL